MDILDSTGLSYLISKIKAAFWSKSETTQVTVDSTPTANSTNLVTSGGVKTAIDAKYTKPTNGIPASDLESGVIPSISTSLPADKADNTKTAGAKATYDEIHPATQSSQPAGGLLPNVLYNLGTLTGSVTIAFAAATDANIENEYKFTFETSTTAPNITFPNSIVSWLGNCVDDATGQPELDASKHYEISVVNNYAYIGEF